MKSGSTRFWTSVLTGLLSVLLVAFVVVALEDWDARLDLTEDKRFTLPEAAEHIAAGLEDDLLIEVYLSDSLPSYLRFLPSVLATRLQEFREASGERISFRFIDPAEWPEDDERRADLAARGIVPAQATDRVEGKVTSGAYYLTLDFRYQDQEERLDLRELGNTLLSESAMLQLLPFQIASRLVKLTKPDIKVGIASKKYNHATQQGQPPQPTDGLIDFRQRLTSHVPNIVDVDLANGAAIPDDLTCLIVHRPERYSTETVARLEQYLLGGGRVVVLLDTFSTADHDRQFDLQMAMQPQGQGMLKVRKIDLGAMGTWLEGFGVTASEGYLESVSCVKDQVAMPEIVTLPNGQQIATMRPQVREIPHVAVVMEKTEDGDPAGWFDPDSPILAGVGGLGLMTSVPLLLAEEGKAPALTKTAAREVLLRTTDETFVRALDGGKFQLLRKEGDGVLPPKEEWKSWPLIVSFRGQFHATMGGNAAGPEGGDETGDEGGDQTPPTENATLTTSSAPGQLWVVADSDFANNWAKVLALQMLRSAQAESAMRNAQTAVVNLIDSITVGDEIVAMRRPLIADRSMKADKVEKDSASIRLRTVGWPAAALVAFGILVWFLRAVRTRVPSPRFPSGKEVKA